MTTDFQLVFDRATELYPQLTPRNSSAIYGWLAAGADPVQDIIPTMERIHKVKQDVGGFMYFTKAIEKAVQERRAASEIAKPEEPALAPDEASKARMIARTVRVFGIRNSVNEKWLAEYEARHGEVML